jgi:PHD/YefM family antitoxin component YafN of YafNO toxin-antitoxin module
MTAPTKARGKTLQPVTTRSKTRLEKHKPLEPQYVTDANGKRTAVLIPLETWERFAPMLQTDLEKALNAEPVSEHISPSLAKRLRERGQGIKGELLTPEEFQAEVERLRK